ncbi:MAG: ATP-binding protein [Planctomycetota bacterium]|nr:ATP-binding protein [Planctomycetota bacterium]
MFARRNALRVRRLERRAQGAERLAELGTLTGGLAHEIKNPLSTINLNVQLLQEDLREAAAEFPAGSPQRDKLARAVRRSEGLTREVQRLRDILEDFLKFAGRVKLDLAPTDVNALVGELADFFIPQAQAAGVRLRTQLAASPSTAVADGALLKQAILNLLINGIHAMTEARQSDRPHGGANELIIRTERFKNLGHEEIHIHVTDTAGGIPPDRIERIFQPYFSTKKGGTGLGLPTARRIVDEHGGTLTVHSDIGRGSDFVIALPAPRGGPTRDGAGKEAAGARPVGIGAKPVGP